MTRCATCKNRLDDTTYKEERIYLPQNQLTCQIVNCLECSFRGSIILVEGFKKFHPELYNKILNGLKDHGFLEKINRIHAAVMAAQMTDRSQHEN